MGLDLFHVVLTATPQHEYFTIDDFISAADFLEKHKHLFFEVDSADTGKTLAVYWKEMGYQRKGMNKDFFQHFENCKLYFDISSVGKAALYLELSSSRPEIPQSFIEGFIDNFVAGESIFFASW